MLRSGQTIILSAALGLVLAPSLAVGGHPRAWQDAKALAAQTGKPILIDFFADW